MNELEALGLALEVEKNELELYLNLARKVKDKKAKNMFLFLAGQEFEHLKSFEEKFLEFAIEECKLPAVDKELLKKLIINVKEVESEVEALKIAMEQEKLTWEFYENAAKSAEKESVRRVFEELAKAEEEHYELLKAQYDSVMKTGIWMDYQDFNLEVE
ncbi:ferritin family protein [Pyrococcus kukulkanii]|uniref:ferritin family protein n=1 Tax=Pyrococcus kukulkanii TaxID=1609559 RepID=UPI003566D302